jgi:hypothetical protein
MNGNQSPNRRIFMTHPSVVFLPLLAFLVFALTTGPGPAAKPEEVPISKGL